jgi:hypothetical protein
MTEVCNNPNARQGMGGALLRTASRGWKVEKVHFLQKQDSLQGSDKTRFSKTNHLKTGNQNTKKDP